MQQIGSLPLIYDRPLGFYKDLFSTLAAPDLDSLAGTYRGEFVGPGWFRTVFVPVSLTIGGLHGWWGKQFHGPARGINIVSRHGGLQRIVPVTLDYEPSRIDGKPCLGLHYPAGSPLPWVWTVDEFRRLDDTTLLALSTFVPRWVPRVGLPFLLHKVTG